MSLSRAGVAVQQPHRKTTQQNVGRRLEDAVALEDSLEDAMQWKGIGKFLFLTIGVASSKYFSSAAASSKRLPMFCWLVLHCPVSMVQAFSHCPVFVAGILQPSTRHKTNYSFSAPSPPNTKLKTEQRLIQKQNPNLESACGSTLFLGGRGRVCS